MLAGSGAKRTLVGTTVPTLTLKLTLGTRGALLLLMTVFLITVFCCVVRLTVALALADDEDADEALESLASDLPVVLLADLASALFGDDAAFEAPEPAVEVLSFSAAALLAAAFLSEALSCAVLPAFSSFFSALLSLLASPALAAEPPLAADEEAFLPAVEAPVPMVEDAPDPLSDFVAEDAPVPMDEEVDCAYANVAVPASSVAASAAKRTCLKVI